MSLRKVIETRGSFPESGRGAEAVLFFSALVSTSRRSGPCRCRTGRRPCSVSRFCWETVFRKTRWYKAEGKKSEARATELRLMNRHGTAAGLSEPGTKPGKTNL